MPHQSLKQVHLSSDTLAPRMPVQQQQSMPTPDTCTRVLVSRSLLLAAPLFVHPKEESRCETERDRERQSSRRRERQKEETGKTKENMDREGKGREGRDEMDPGGCLQTMRAHPSQAMRMCMHARASLEAHPSLTAPHTHTVASLPCGTRLL